MSSTQPGLFEEDSSAVVEPRGLSYREGFIDALEEQHLIGLVRALPLAHAEYKEYTALRRVKSFGSSYDFSANELREAQPIPGDYDWLRARLADWLGVPKDDFTQLLVAEYAPGTPLGWHRDVPDYEFIAGVSLGSPATLRFRPYPPTREWKSRLRELEVEPRSAYTMQGPARWDWQHAVPPTPGLRWSLTFRTRRNAKRPELRFR